MRCVPFVAALILALVSLMHLLRLVFHVEVVAGGWTIPFWPSALGFAATGLLAILLFREARRA